VGDRDFFRILRAWAAGKAGGNGTTGQFIALAERVSGRQLDALFTTWLFTPAKPPPAAAAATASAARGQATLATRCRGVRGGCATGRR
jgi:aminopeptidase N